MKRRYRFLGLLALVLVMLMTGTVLAQGTQELTGWLNVLYGDSPNASVRQITLTTDDGTIFPVEIAPDVLRREGGITRLAGQRLIVEVASVGLTRNSALTVRNVVRRIATDSGNGPRATNYNWVNLLCRYDGDASEDVDTTYINSFYGNNYRRLNDYFPELSRNEISVSGDVYDWRELPGERTDYLNADGEGDLVAIWSDCIDQFNADIDFSTGVDGIAIILNDEIDGFAWGGSVTGTLDGVNQSWPTIWMPPWASTSMNVWTHEIGHAIGLPHSNNSDGDADPYDNPWDMMSAAWSSIQQDPNYGTIPFYTIAYHLDLLGWMNPADKFTYGGTTTEITLDSWYYTGSSNYHMAVINNPDATFYTIESRIRPNNDFTAYEDGLSGGDGVVIHHVDAGRDEDAWLINNGTDATPWGLGDTWVAPDGTKVKVFADSAQGYQVRIGVFPDSPTNLVAINDGRYAIDLSWTDSPDDFGYRIEWSPNGIDTWSTLANVPQNTVEYRDEPLECETARSYRVIALDTDADESDPSNVASAITSTCPIELVDNGGFEEGGDPWKPPGAVPNKIVCGGGIAYEGDCAYRFGTDKGEHVKIKQMLDLSDVTEFAIDTGDTLVINGAFNATSDVSRGQYIIDVHYVNLDKARISFPINPTVGWEAMPETEYTLLDAVEKITVEVSYKGKNGTVYVDAISVGVVDSLAPIILDPDSPVLVAPGAKTIPLPEAPEGFRR